MGGNMIESIKFYRPVSAPGLPPRTSWTRSAEQSAEAIGGTIHLKSTLFPGRAIVVPLSNIDQIDMQEHVPEPTKAGGKKGGKQTDPKRA